MRRGMCLPRTGLASGSSPELREAAQWLDVTTAQGWLLPPPSGWPLPPPGGWPPSTARTGGWRSKGWPKDAAMNPMIREVLLQVPEPCDDSDYILRGKLCKYICVIGLCANHWLCSSLVVP